MERTMSWSKRSMSYGKLSSAPGELLTPLTDKEVAHLKHAMSKLSLGLDQRRLASEELDGRSLTCSQGAQLLEVVRGTLMQRSFVLGTLRRRLPDLKDGLQALMTPLSGEVRADVEALLATPEDGSPARRKKRAQTGPAEELSPASLGVCNLEGGSASSPLSKAGRFKSAVCVERVRKHVFMGHVPVEVCKDLQDVFSLLGLGDLPQPSRMPLSLPESLPTDSQQAVASPTKKGMILPAPVSPSNAETLDISQASTQAPSDVTHINDFIHDSLSGDENPAMLPESAVPLPGHQAAKPKKVSKPKKVRRPSTASKPLPAASFRGSTASALADDSPSDSAGADRDGAATSEPSPPAEDPPLLPQTVGEEGESARKRKASKSRRKSGAAGTDLQSPQKGSGRQLSPMPRASISQQRRDASPMPMAGRHLPGPSEESTE
eukprot:TRINITY_DN40311_c0_g2_i1.p1 TRINITY_DN40311_c0_g2~~TRINITY_DN40311_c0_g2_i1.p1  ORF type:complete len:435 (+),score=86.69 TRINITY_DN40311_c0_g2_i1:110-1414(+)